MQHILLALPVLPCCLWPSSYYLVDMSSSLFFLFFSLSLTVPLIYGKQVVVSVNVQAAKDLVDCGYRLLDVRTKEEFRKGHVGNALNVPFWFFTPEGKEVNSRFVEQVSAILNKEDKVVLACQCGVRSLDASIELIKAGYQHVRNMEGGYGAWISNGFDLKVPNDEL